MPSKIIAVAILVLSIALCAQTIDSLPTLPKTSVEIPWTELRGLIELSMQQADVQLTPPVDYIIPNAEYEASISGDVLRGTASLAVVVLKEGYVQVPLFDQNLALSSPKVDGRTAPISPWAGNHTLVLKGPGSFQFTAGFVMELADHVTNFRLNIPRTSSTQFKLTLPEAGIDVKLTPASRLSSRTAGNTTVVEAYVPSTDYLYCEWMKAIPEDEEEKLDPVVYSEVRSLFSVGEGLVRGSSEIAFSVVQGKVDVLRFELPGDVRILDVRSSSLRDWKMNVEGEKRIISAYLKFPAGGTITVTCDYERSMEGVSAIVEMPNVKCVGVDREKGYIGVVATTNVEVSLVEDALETATRIDRSELPQNLWSRTNHPIILAFKYLETPYKVILDIEKHEDLAVKVATADNAAFVAILTSEGNYIVRGTYSVRNNLKQFLSLDLPEDAELWSLFVSGSPSKPGKGEKNRVLVPMEKSRGGEEATTFPVEIVYFVKSKKLGAFGKRGIILPKVDVPVSVMNLSLYLPNGYTYTGFGGNMQEGFGVEPAGGIGRAMGRMDDFAEPNIAPQAKSSRMLESQVAYEEEMRNEIQQASYSSSQKGVMPVRISIPEVGALHRFQKFVVPEDEKGPFPEVKVRYTKRGIKNTLSFVVVILAIIGFYIFAKGLLVALDKASDKQPRAFGSFIGSMIIGFIIILVLSGIARMLSVSGAAISTPWIIGGIGVVIYAFVKYIVRKAKAKREAKKAARIAQQTPPTPPPTQNAGE